MDADTELFVQGFWVKCREVIRPVLDHMIDDLKRAGHAAHVSTQDYSPVADDLPDRGPMLVLTVHPNGQSDVRTLKFHADVAQRDVEIIGSGGKLLRHELADIADPIVKRETADWLAVALNHHP
ncbi:hypothetical protein BH11PSE3_BH11PSE3_06600 [soil metagenome]